MIVSWEQITLDIMNKISRIDTKLSESEKTFIIVSILSGKSVEELKSMPITEYRKLSVLAEFLNESPEPEYPNSQIVLNNTTYNITTLVKDMTAAQFLDYQMLMEHYSQEPDKLQNTEKLLGCFFVPDGHAYNDGYSIDNVQTDIYRYLSITKILGYMRFFIIQWRAYTTATLKYLRRNLTKDKTLTKEQRKTIKENLNILINQVEHLSADSIPNIGHSE